jgi:hypothetical protein
LGGGGCQEAAFLVLEPSQQRFVYYESLYRMLCTELSVIIWVTSAGTTIVISIISATHRPSVIRSTEWSHKAFDKPRVDGPGCQGR